MVQKRIYILIKIISIITIIPSCNYTSELLIPSLKSKNIPSSSNSDVSGDELTPINSKPGNNLSNNNTVNNIPKDKSWSKLSFNANFVVNKFFLIDRKNGWISTTNGDLIKTTDGGVTWEKLLIEPQNWSNIYFIENNGWVVSNNSNETNLLKTNDGGNSWQLTKIPRAFSCNSIQFTSPSTGYISCQSMNFIYQLFKTTDSGENWKLLENSSITQYQDWHFGDDIVGLYGASLTDDGGNSFVRNPNIPSDGGYYNKTFFINDSICYRTTSNSIFKSMDQGQSWQKIGATEFVIKDVTFINENQGWIVGNNNVVYTQDGGVTWESQNININSLIPVEVQMIDSNNGWILTNNGEILNYQ